MKQNISGFIKRTMYLSQSDLVNIKPIQNYSVKCQITVKPPWSDEAPDTVVKLVVKFLLQIGSQYAG